MFYIGFQPRVREMYLVSAITRPSSTQAILVVMAPMSTTQALEIPAP
jgi:hypothetical protein